MTQQNTHHPLAESLSSLMDNEASELELQRVLKASESDSEVKATWSRYQVARAALHRDLPLLEMGDFAARVSAALEQEENHTIASAPVIPEKKAVQWWQNVARFAVAASVAGGVVLFAQNFGGVNPEAPAAVAATPQVDTPTTAAVPAPSLPAGYHAQPLSARAVGLQTGYESRQQDNRQVIFVPLPSSSQTAAQVSDDEVRDYLNKLIEEHADNAALNSGQGMLPFARVVLTEED
jgi:sigma-E factor negative regulatory protein RseA